METGGQAFYAYEVHPPSGMSLATAPVGRDWMDKTDRRYAYRCLPMLLANTNGWFIRNPIDFSVLWNGGGKQEDLVINFPNSQVDTRVASHFGNGVLTFTIPYLFRTPKSINLWVHGPANCPKDGIHALEGIVESDWFTGAFTMNWKVTRPGHAIKFVQDEPICMITPVARGLSEQLVPVLECLDKNDQMRVDYESWRKKRADFLEQLSGDDIEAVQRGWEKDYYKGLNKAGQAFPEHQTQITLKNFQKA
jgi:hypothetical protein